MKFSVIIPVYKVERYLHDCVQSVLSQTYTDFEIILVDDGSPDRCPQLCDDFALRDKRVKVIHQQNAGIACARNAGIKVARGEYLICIDSDDFFFSEYIFQHIADKTNDGVDVVLYGFKKLYESNGRFGRDVVPKFDGVLHTKTMLEKVLSDDSYCGAAWTKAVRLRLLYDNGIEFRPGMISGEDIDWYLHLMCRANTYCSINEVAVIYRQHCGSISHAPRLKSLTDNLWILEFWSRRIKEMVEKDDTVEALYHILAYYYANDMILFAGFNRDITRPYRERLKMLNWLLDFAITSRALKIKRFYHALGFDITVITLRILSRLKTRQ